MFLMMMMPRDDSDGEKPLLVCHRQTTLLCTPWHRSWIGCVITKNVYCAVFDVDLAFPSTLLFLVLVLHRSRDCVYPSFLLLLLRSAGGDNRLGLARTAVGPILLLQTISLPLPLPHSYSIRRSSISPLLTHTST